jgi:hypothetical protein
MGQKLVRFGTRRDTRSRQDEPIEVHEVGSKRPSLFGVQWGAFRLVRWADLRLVVGSLLRAFVLTHRIRFPVKGGSLTQPTGAPALRSLYVVAGLP